MMGQVYIRLLVAPIRQGSKVQFNKNLHGAKPFATNASSVYQSSVGQGVVSNFLEIFGPGSF